MRQGLKPPYDWSDSCMNLYTIESCMNTGNSNNLFGISPVKKTRGGRAQKDIGIELIYNT